MFEIVIIVQLRLVNPNRNEMRIRDGAQCLERRIVRQPVLVRFSVEVGDGPKQQLFTCRQNQLSLRSDEYNRLLLASAVGLELVTIVGCSIRQFYFFKLLSGVEKLCSRQLV